jgi:ferredoxin
MAYVIGDDCVTCGTCIDECPVGAISEGDTKYSINPDMCTECGTCASVCPQEAISLP